MSNDGQYGVIHEVGNLGLGYTPVSEKEQKQLEEAAKQKEENNK